MNFQKANFKGTQAALALGKPEKTNIKKMENTSDTKKI